MSTTHIYVFARWKVKAGQMQTVLELLKEVRSKTIMERGNLFYKINQSNADANTLILFEGYEDDIAQKEHMSAFHFKNVVVDQIVPLLDEREITLATPLMG